MRLNQEVKMKQKFKNWEKLRKTKNLVESETFGDDLGCYYEWQLLPETQKNRESQHRDLQPKLNTTKIGSTFNILSAILDGSRCQLSTNFPLVDCYRGCFTSNNRYVPMQ